MLESLTSLAYGFNIALQPQNLLYCFIGVTMGTLVGVLPGIGPTATIALLLPATFKLNPIAAIIMLSGICYGAMYGGSTTSILLNIPGEASSVVTCLDGYQMARKDRAGPELGISAFGSFIAGTVSIFSLILLAPTLADFALKFGPPEYLALMVMGLTVVAYLGGEAKFWVEPEVKLAQNYGLRGKELQDARSLIEEHINEIKTAWKKHFAS